MRYWLDTEFMEDGRLIEPLSIGIVAEDGREYYAEFYHDPKRANIWVAENVFPHLKKRGHLKPTAQIRQELLSFTEIDLYGKPEFWAYQASYDWVLMCQIFGRMVDLPPGWPRYCNDIKQLADELGNPRLPADPQDEHFALADAQWDKQVWNFLMGLRIKGKSLQ